MTKISQGHPANSGENFKNECQERITAHKLITQFWGCYSFEEVTSKLRAVICDDAVGDPEPAHEALDELDSSAGWNGSDGFHFRPLGELVNGDVEIMVAPWHSWERA